MTDHSFSIDIVNSLIVHSHRYVSGMINDVSKLKENVLQLDIFYVPELSLLVVL